jgi:hypothetical protein
MRGKYIPVLFLLLLLPCSATQARAETSPIAQIPDAVPYDADYNMFELYMVNMVEKLTNTLDKTPLPFMHFAPKAEESIVLRYMRDYKKENIDVTEQEAALMVGLVLGDAAAFRKMPPNKLKEKPLGVEEYCLAVPEGVTPFSPDLLLAVRPSTDGFHGHPPKLMEITGEQLDRLTDAFVQRYEEAGQSATRRRATISAGMALGWAYYLQRLESSGFLDK